MADYTLTAKLMADAKNFSSGFTKAQDSLSRMESRFKNFGRSIGRIGDDLTRKITLPAVGAATALGGITLAKGFSRLTGIDTAQAKLKGLGHDAENIEEIMNSALDSVRGTSYGLDSAANTAASAVAAGITPGQELTRYLTLTGDAAAIAGDSLDGMGSIFNKVSTANRAYNGELQMLSERGLPIYQWLAEEANTSADAVRDMAADGAISSEMFLSAIEKNIGGAALTMGEESFMAGLANIGAAVGRLGANFLDAGGEAGGFFSTVKPLIGEFIGFIDNLADKSTELGIRFGEAFNSFIGRVIELKARFDELPEPIQDLIIKGSAIGGAFLIGIGPALKIVSMLSGGIGILASVFTFLLSPIGLVIGVIAGLAALFIYLWNTNEEFRDKVVEIWTNLKNTLFSIVDEIWLTLQTLWQQYGQVFLDIIRDFIDLSVDLFLQLAGYAEDIWITLKGIWDEYGQSIIDGFLDFIGGIIEIAEQLWGHLKPLFDDALSFLDHIWNEYLSDIVFTVVDFVAKLIDGALDLYNGFILPLVSWLIDFLVPKIRSAFDMAANIAEGLFASFSEIFDGIMRTLGGVIDFIVGVFTGDWSRAWQGIIDIFGGIWDSLVGMAKTPINAVIGLVNGLIGSLNSVNINIPKVPDWIPGIGGRGGGSIGFNIPKIPYLQRGTDDWQGGFARMNEGGRGELVALPSGTQVIPHDVSMRYAREAGRRAGIQSTVMVDRGEQEQPKQPIIVEVYDNKEAVRAFVNESDAVDAEIRRFE